MKHIAKLTAFLFLLFLSKIILAQNTGPATGLVIGSILDAENSKAIQDAGVTIMLLSDTSIQVTQLSNANGEFILDKLGFGFYRLRVTAVGYSALLIDSIHIRAID